MRWSEHSLRFCSGWKIHQLAWLTTFIKAARHNNYETEDNRMFQLKVHADDFFFNFQIFSLLRILVMFSSLAEKQ